MDVLYLFHRYRDDVYRLAVNFTHNPQEAEDVCQNVFLKLMEQGELIPGKEKAWLMQVTANECRSLLRSSWWKKSIPLDPSIPAPDYQMDETIQVVLSLPPKYRVVIYLHYYEQYSATEIGALLKLPVSTVTTRLSRGREMLKKKLGEPERGG